MTRSNTTKHPSSCSWHHVSVAAAVAVALVLATGCSTENTPVAEKAAVAEASAWLQLIDQHNLTDAWGETVPVIRDARSEERWVNEITAARQPLGALVDRRAGRGRYEDNPEGYAPGTYVITTFETEFTDAGLVEELVVMKLVDNEWMAARYVVPAGT